MSKHNQIFFDDVIFKVFPVHENNNWKKPTDLTQIILKFTLLWAKTKKK